MLFKGAPLPPRSLTVLIIALTVVPLAALLWLGWRLLDQDRVLEDKQAHDHVEHAADLLVAAFQRAIAFDEQRLAAGTEDWPEGAASIVIRDDRVAVYPRNRVAFLPVVPPLPEPPVSVFDVGDQFDFRMQNHSAAITVFRELAKSPDPAVRAGALLRLGSDFAATGRVENALAAYDQLATMDGIAIEGVPAGLIGRYTQCALLEAVKRPDALRSAVQRFAGELSSSRWDLTSPLYALYAGDVAKWSGAAFAGNREPEVFAEAVHSLWERRHSRPANGSETVVVGDQKLTALWQGSENAFHVLLTSPDYAASHWLSTAALLAQEQGVSFNINDASQPALGGVGPVAKRSARETDLPWNLSVTSNDGTNAAGNFALRRRLFVAGFLLLAAMATTANYLIIRAIRHDRAVSRLQSDFVAAVSHEFRTPLTALRQFTDMLRDHESRTPDPEQDKDRRMICYDAQSRATERLTRLVESLLDFGRMEAGARRYTFERQDCPEFIRRVVEDFSGPAETAGYQVRFSGNGAASIQADGEALSRAIWNLLDNAMKYSPGHKEIEVGLHRQGGDVRIDVRDYGIGIPAHEHSAIFEKFQRGEQARTRGIKGTGIGLTMVDEIVRAHHGRVEVQSEPGKGSTFSIVLPVKD